MRFRLLAAAVLLGTIVSPLAAQSRDTPRFEVAAGYSFMRDQDILQNLPAGWVASVAGNITSWLGLVGEVGGHRKTLSIPGDPPTLSVFTFMGGPRFTARAVRPVTPFAQVLFGSARARSTVLDVGDTVTDFAYQPGGGVDVTLTRNVAIRLEGDYRIIRADGSNSKESRFVSAAVIGFGR